ncbi:MAG: hypothetical protein LW806_11945 [Planctomycetaceae bacterium]|nr:hypothetical protein [Planctomycetaceae bacterium]
MTTPNEQNQGSPDSPDASDPEFVVRAVLGKASESERKAVEARAATDRAAARLVGQLRDVRDAIATSAAEASDPAPRALFERAFALSSRLPRVPSWLDRLKAAVLEPIEQGLAGFAQPALRGAGGGLQSFARADWRLDAAVERMADGTPALRIQIEGPVESLSGEIALLDATSGRVLSEGMLDADGACALALPSGSDAVESVDLAFRTQGETFTVRGIRAR